MVDFDTYRARWRNQVTEKYLKEVREGQKTVAQILEIIPKLEVALKKAERSRRRVRIEGAEIEGTGTSSADEIQDQISRVVSLEIHNLTSNRNMEEQ